MLVVRCHKIKDEGNLLNQIYFHVIVLCILHRLHAKIDFLRWSNQLFQVSCKLESGNSLQFAPFHKFTWLYCPMYFYDIIIVCPAENSLEQIILPSPKIQNPLWYRSKVAHVLEVQVLNKTFSFIVQANQEN